MSKFQNYERLKRAGATVRLDLYLITKAESNCRDRFTVLRGFNENFMFEAVSIPENKANYKKGVRY